MAYAAVTSLMGTLYLHFLQSHPRFPLQNKLEIVSLHENIGFLQEILEKSEIAAYDDARMRGLEAEMRDVLFKAEERIETELSNIYLQPSSKTACLLRLHGIFNEAVKQTDYLKKKLIKIKGKQQLLSKGSSITGVSLLLGWMRPRGLLLGSTSSQPNLERDNASASKFSKSASMFDSRMVGCDKEFKKIMDQLTRHSAEQLQVVSIVGMGGIGKTTLARKIYEHPSITDHFYMRAWVTVSQEYNVEQMLECLIGCIIAASGDESPEHSDVLEEEQRNPKDELSESLRKHLQEQRYLIVMDDIWSTTAWDSVQRCFPDDNNGSRILLTSRLREVAEYASSSGNSLINMPFLDANESWNLYCNVFGKMEFPSVFEQIGRDIVKKCEGLPLAIIVVASLLSKMEDEEEKWMNVAKNVRRSVIGDSKDACSRILSLSYNQLPQHLKACFLYFGVFPEDYEIPVKKLVRLWAGEGFLRAVKHETLEEVGIEWLQDLVDRSLVVVSKQRYNGEMKRIRIHDLLRDLCLREARHENMLSVIGDERPPFHKRILPQHVFSKPCRWISHTSESFDNEIRSKCFHKFHSLHSSIFVCLLDMNCLLSPIKLLRVLDMKYVTGHRTGILTVLANLVHLRYFALTCNDVGEYTLGPVYVLLFEHWNLQSFIIRGGNVELNSLLATSGIWKMPLLRNFYIEKTFSIETPSVVCRSLENISWLDAESCTEDLFIMIPNLKKLGVNVGNKGNIPFYNFVHLGQLEKLSIRIWLERLELETSFLPNLKKLKFVFAPHLQWSEMRLIGMLPNLEVLKLIYAFQGRKWQPCEGGFRRLKRLVIENTDLQYWEAMGDHFPVLECLELSECDLLEEIPSGFADIHTLALIHLNKCLDSLLASAKRIQDEQHSYGNDALLVRAEKIWSRRLNSYIWDSDEEEE